MKTDTLQRLKDILKRQSKIIDQLQCNVGLMIGYIDGMNASYNLNRDNIKVIHFNADYKNPDQEEDEKQKKSGG